MSRKTGDTVKCPKCKETICYDRWESINTSLNPEVKMNLLSGTFGEVVCPRCGTKSFLEYNFLYHDMQGKYMISVSDDYTDVLKNFTKIEGYRYRYVECTGDLVEKINIFDAGLNDIVIEIMKGVLKELLHIKERLSFVKREDDFFLFYMTEANKVFSIKSDMYYKILEDCNDDDLEEKYEFMKIGY